MSSIKVDETAFGRFQLGRVFAIAGSAFRSQWLPMILFSLLLAFAPVALFNNLISINAELPLGGGLSGHLRPAEVSIGRGGSYAALSLAGLALTFVLGTSLGVAHTSLTFASQAGEGAAWRRAVGHMLRDTLPLVLLTLVSTLALLSGFILLVVPGLIMMTAWCLTFPVRVSERTGLITTFRRSAELTQGHRWLILGVFAIWVVVYALVQTLPVAAIHAAIGQDPPAAWIIEWLIYPSVSVVTGLIIDLLVAALYLELRRVHDGIAIESLDRMFA